MKSVGISLALLATCCISAASEAAITRAEAKKIWRDVAEPTALSALPFYVMVEETPNAWVRNGEFASVTTGLLELLEAKDELYAIFAHEAGHIRLSHMRKRDSLNAGLSAATMIMGQLFGEETSSETGSHIYGWSREQIREADDFAVELAVKMGADPVGMYNAVAKLAEADNAQQNGFNSHPLDAERLAHIKNKILELKPDAIFK